MGKPVGIYDQLSYSFLSTEECKKSPVTVHFRCTSPMRLEPIDGNIVFNCDAYSLVLGRGKASGVGSVRPDQDEPERFRFFLRIVITFPTV